MYNIFIKDGFKRMEINKKAIRKLAEYISAINDYRSGKVPDKPLIFDINLVKEVAAVINNTYELVMDPATTYWYPQANELFLMVYAEIYCLTVEMPECKCPTLQSCMM